MQTQMKALIICFLTILLLCGCGSSDEPINFGNNQSSPPPPAPAGISPVARDDAYATVVNRTLNVAAAVGLSANDPAVAPVTDFQNPSAQGGTVTVQPDGSFTYTPPPDFLGNDSFTYTISSSAGAAGAVVRMAVVLDAIFVNNTAPPGGNGSFEMPFATLAAAMAVARPADAIFIFRGDGTTRGLDTEVRLQQNQRLIGEEHSAGLPVLTGPIRVQGDATTIANLRFEPANPPAGRFQTFTGPIISASNRSGTIASCQFGQGLTGAAIELTAASGEWIIRDNLFEPTELTSVFLGTLPGSNSTYRVLANTFQGSGGALFLGASGAATLRAQILDNQVTSELALDSFSFVAGTNSTLCLQLLNNSTGGNFFFVSDATSTLNVERLSELTSLNSILTVANLNNAATEVPDGFCGF